MILSREFIHISRMRDEKLLRIVSRTQDRYHLGNEVIVSTHTSPVVRKGSPMKVFCKVCWMKSSTDYSCYLATTRSQPGLDERHGYHPKDAFLLQNGDGLHPEMVA